METAVGPDEGLLRDVLRILPMPKYAVRNPEREGARVPQTGLELLRQIVIGAHHRLRVTVHQVTHSGPGEQDAADGRDVQKPASATRHTRLDGWRMITAQDRSSSSIHLAMAVSSSALASSILDRTNRIRSAPAV